MLVGIFIFTVLLSSIVTGQTEDFELECNILKTLDNLEVRLRTQETLLEQQTNKLQLQEALLENQTVQIQRQETLLQNQTVQLQQQKTLLDQAEDRIRELESKNATLEQPKADCAVLYANGTTLSGVYSISPDKISPFDVYCDMTDDGWTVIQRRIDGAVNFNRTWDEYVKGFGNVSGEYWLGLEKIHRLAKDGAEIYFDIGNYDGTRDYAHYKNFTVHDATTLYKMNVDASGYNGSFYENFSWHNNMKFSTYDRDNDYHPFNCAQIHGGGGWWYNSCFNIGSFNGIFGKKTLGGMQYLAPGSIYVKTVTIKVRQRPS